MTTATKSATTPPTHDGDAGREQSTPNEGKPKTSGYAETRRSETSADNGPNPAAAGDEASQVESAVPGKKDDEAPDDTEDSPPGEHKREPIKDPDPADAPLQVRRK